MIVGGKLYFVAYRPKLPLRRGSFLYSAFGRTEKKVKPRMNIHLYGADARLGFCRDYLIKENFRYTGRIILLPIPTTKDGKSLHGCKVSLEDFVKECAPGDAVAMQTPIL